ncbi:MULTISPECIES: CRISPR-associated helicase/endonuclease Cas3 [unclassified Streptomyces]|uniref:CRISPR-associated helicase/endonuclease Cas3 n=1 Tax=unclassified Streptomyces TaxID=2593676 RepID=UPI000D0FC461|nr:MULTISPECIES: CRISPR-associated helicase/endonuclease Cas3 [unclassified Streptomyces]MYT32195.1 CRISPR-associated helicase/endonuclease Cas3 [Streptomyces sp. SID8354]
MRSIADLMREMGLSEETVARVSRLWGKSAARNGGRTHLLLGHLLDTAAVAEVMWERYLSVAMRRRLEEVSGGRGRLWFMWICGIHDCGKACPAFQALDDAEAAPVRAAGLVWGRLPADRRQRWRHDVAGAALLRPRLVAEWGSSQSAAWVWPLVAGHHGTFPSVQGLKPKHREVQGRGAAWEEAQRAVVDVFTRAIGFADLADARPVGVLSRAEQLGLSGLIVMADWIASDSEQFEGIADARAVSLDLARERAEAAWQRLGLRGGWNELTIPDDRLAPLTGRLRVVPRASQRELVERAWSMPAPGLMVAEAPMGEGKTKAALAAAEVLAARFGLDGVFVAMPTQATCDPMYEQVLEWVRSFDPDLEAQVALLHGKRRFNPTWREIWESKRVGAVGESGWGDESAALDPFDVYGATEEDAEYGMSSWASDESCGVQEGRDGPARWFLGNKRGLLTAFAVGTVDHLLHAATRTRHVMLRFAGLVGKVVVVDEVHAADVYMRQFLLEALRWLGQAKVPVVLLSATLPPAQRQACVDAYLTGAMSAADVVCPVPEPAGYPCVTVAYSLNGASIAESSREVVPSWRASTSIRIDWLPDVAQDGELLASTVREEVADGGVALVVVNQVDRAQAMYRALTKAGFEGQVRLLHGRLCSAHRAERTEECLRLLGPGAKRERPDRMVVIATQLAEQSFDVDADLLITDLAPVDLLLQRIGRLHRHSGTRRSSAFAEPRVLVTGVVAGERGRPRFLPASKAIYGEWALLRAAALVAEAAGPLSGEIRQKDGWSIPADVPGLVARAYEEAEVCPPDWDEAAAREERQAKEQQREKSAEGFLLTRPREWGASTLEGLHYGGISVASEEDLDAVVRDGKRSVEAVIVRRSASGYRAIDGTWIGVHGEVDDETVIGRLLGGTVRLPSRLTEAAEAEETGLVPLPGWVVHPWLRYAPALVLEEDGTAVLGKDRVSYDDVLGLVVERG